jgi:thiamine-phosphate pyrophosphorylase
MKTALPRLMLVTERRIMQPDFSAALEAALRGGARLVQLREKDLAPDEVLPFAREAAALCNRHGAQLVINHETEIASQIDAGLHLPESAVLRFDAARQTLGSGVLVGASAHSLEAAQQAESSGADYLVFGSVFETASHPGSTPAGLAALRVVVASVAVPVFAIGGITQQNARACRAAGAHGVAVIRAAWSTSDVETTVRRLNKVLAS